MATGATDFSPMWEYDVQTDVFVPVRELTGPPPSDVPLCGFTGNELICQQDHRVPVSVIVVAVLLSLLLIAGAVGWIFYSTVRKLRIQLKPDWWKITLTEIQFTHQRTRTFNGVHSRSIASFTSSASSELPPPHFHGRAFSTARYMESDVLIHHVSEESKVKATSSHTLKEINLLRNVDHENLHKFIGLLVDKPETLVIAVVRDECSKGDLTTLLSNHTFTLDWVVKASFIRDLVHGMAYLHSTSLQSHGNLTSHNCLVNGKFTLKVSEYGLSFLRSEGELQPLTDTQQSRNHHHLLWRAPELLSIVMPVYGTQKGDVYSFAIILSQIILESQPFEFESGKGSANPLTAAEIALEV
ncbi:hypothetical protein RvY_17572-2 [Ramazzottius varieornatus]|nr:hypothetical protein RvY_17572-2 [Ramazzottius varieornatus]